MSDLVAAAPRTSGNSQQALWTRRRSFSQARLYDLLHRALSLSTHILPALTLRGAQRDHWRRKEESARSEVRRAFGRAVDAKLVSNGGRVNNVIGTAKEMDAFDVELEAMKQINVNRQLSNERPQARTHGHMWLVTITLLTITLVDDERYGAYSSHIEGNQARDSRQQDDGGGRQAHPYPLPCAQRLRSIIP